MYVKKLKRKCSVRGCSNTDTYSISHSSEAGNTVIICKSCLGKALSAIDDAPYAPQIRVPHEDAPSLSLGSVKRKATPAPAPAEPEAPVIEEAVPAEAEVDTEEGTATTPAEEPAEFVCPHCGQICKSELGLRSHINAKHKDVI